MANLKKVIISSILIFVAFFTFASSSSAATPTLSLSSVSNGDTVTLTVNGDANSSVIFYYTRTNVGLEIAVLGTTNSSGYFSTTISSSSYGIASYSTVYVKLGGINGTSSSETSWPYVSSTSTTSTISLSQTGLVLNVGSSSSITVNNNSSALYLSNNTNPTVANISLNTSHITVTANSAGSTIATVCAVNSSSNCASVYITVQASGTAALTFSVNNLTIANGQNAAITISGGTGSYYVLSNSNSSIISTSVSNSVITLTANATSGSSSITVCSTNMSSCGIITATASTTNSSYLSFSNNAPTISTGESATVTVSGTSGGTYYISNNSNSGIVQATISNSTLTLYGITNGSSILTVCSSLGSCGTITATVSYTSSGGKLALSQTSLSLLVGQAVSITVSGGATPYSLQTASDNIVQANLNSNVLTVHGLGSGVSTVWVCSAEGGCTSLIVTVGTSTSATTGPYFSQNSVSLVAGTNTTVAIYGSGSFFVYSNSNSNVASVQISGSTALVYGLTTGSANVSICQGSSSYCTTLYIAVTSTPVTTSTNATTSLVNYFSLSRYLGPGDKGDDVLNLQNALVKLGLLSATPNGYYGVGTTSAIKAFQKKYNINQTGNVGPSTKSTLETLKILLTGSNSSNSSEATQIAQLEALIVSLTAQIKALIK